MKRIYSLIIALIMVVSIAANSKIQRIEPAFWWTDMHDPELMLLIQGTEIGHLEAELKFDGVEIIKTQKTSNPNYLFIYLNISAQAQAGQFTIKLKDGSKVRERIKYTLKDRKEGSSLRSSFGPEDVMYLLMPDRFANGNPSNDSTPDTKEKANRKDPNGRHGGDIQGIIDHLGYLENLGITALWTTPLLEDNQESYSYHHYAITDFYKIDSRFGTNEDYVRLSKECKKHGIKLIMDLVPNHCGLNHWWINDLPDETWIHQFDEFTRSNYRMSTVNDPYASEHDKMLNTKGWFDTIMPDLNLKHPQVLKYFKQFAIFWVEYADLEGLRVDTYPYNDIYAAADWVKAIMDEYPNLNIVGECWQHRPSEIAYWQAGTKNYDDYNSGMKSVMDFPLTDAFMTALNDDDQGWDNGLAKFYNNYVLDYLYKDPYNLLVFVDNHDIQRFATNINSSYKKYQMAMTHLLTTRGIPQIYAGTEIMMTGVKDKGDGYIRKDFPGGWPGDSRDAFSQTGRTKAEDQAYTHLQKLIQYRNANPVLQTGKFKHFVPANNVYTYFRYNDDKTVMVIMNNQRTKQMLDLTRFQEMLSGYNAGKSILNNKTYKLNAPIPVLGKSALLLELIK